MKCIGVLMLVWLAGISLIGCPIVVIGVSVSPATVSLFVGATQQLTATVSPANATNPAVSWSTSNASVATVSATGLVTGKGEGSATVTATTADGKTATCAVNVTARKLSGKVFDALTGNPVSGATVDFAAYSATTAADGSFAVDFGTGAGTVTGAFCVHVPGYQVTYYSGFPLDTNVATAMTYPMIPVDSSTYTKHSLSGKGYELQTSATTPTEIANGSFISWSIFNKNGGSSSGGGSYTAGTGYSTNSYAFGNDCLVVARVTPAGTGMNPFTVVMAPVDLSASSTTLDITQDLAHTTTVTVTGDAIGNGGGLSLVSPYGIFSVGSVTFDTSVSKQMSVTNPYGYQCIWMQMQSAMNNPSSGYVKMLMSTSDVAAIGTSVTLPAILSTLGPTAAADPTTLDYAADGTLSISPVAGAAGYAFMLTDNGTGKGIGSIQGAASVSLPSWLKSQLASKSIRVSIMVVDSNMDPSKVWSLFAYSGTMPGASYGTVYSMSGANYKDLTF